MLPRAAGTLVASKQSVLNTPDLPLNEKKLFFFFSRFSLKFSFLEAGGHPWHTHGIVEEGGGCRPVRDMAGS